MIKNKYSRGAYGQTRNHSSGRARRGGLVPPAGQTTLVYCALLICLTGCAQHAKESPAPPMVDAVTPGSAIKTETASKDTGKESVNTQDNSQLLSDLSHKLLKYKLDKLPSSAIICSVNGIPITMGDYRRQFKNEQQKIQASLTYNPQLKDNLLKMAHSEGVSLSTPEKQRLIKSVDKMQAGGTKGFNKMLSEGHINKRQFDDQVLDIGLACHVANLIIERDLLIGLINIQLLSQAAKDNGFSKEAMNKYIEVSKSSQYKKLLATGGFSASELQNQIVNNELCQKQVEKILSESSTTDTEISDFYEHNRNKFKHGARIRLSEIAFQLPGKDGVSAVAIKEQAKKENPNISAAALETAVADAQKQKYTLAKSLLERARKGEDFAALADQYSEGQNSRQKNGGDLGFQDQSKLGQDAAAKLAVVPVGGVAPEVIVNEYGYFIFKVTGKEGPGYYKLDDIKNDLKRLLQEKKADHVVDKWLIAQRKTASIVISPEMQKFLDSKNLEKRDN